MTYIPYAMERNMEVDWGVKIVEGMFYLALASVIVSTFFRLNKQIRTTLGGIADKIEKPPLR